LDLRRLFFELCREKISGIVNNDGQGKHAAQRGGYRFLSSCLSDPSALKSSLRRDTATKSPLSGRCKFVFIRVNSWLDCAK
jgi:hypothetical protein